MLVEFAATAANATSCEPHSWVPQMLGKQSSSTPNEQTSTLTMGLTQTTQTKTRLMTMNPGAGPGGSG